MFISLCFVYISLLCLFGATTILFILDEIESTEREDDTEEDVIMDENPFEEEADEEWNNVENEEQIQIEKDNVLHQILEGEDNTRELREENTTDNQFSLHEMDEIDGSSDNNEDTGGNSESEEENRTDDEVEEERVQFEHLVQGATLTQLHNKALYTGSKLTCLTALVLIQQFIIAANINKTNSLLLFKLLRMLLPDSNLQLPTSLSTMQKVCNLCVKCCIFKLNHSFLSLFVLLYLFATCHVMLLVSFSLSLFALSALVYPLIFITVCTLIPVCNMSRNITCNLFIITLSLFALYSPHLSLFHASVLFTPFSWFVPISIGYFPNRSTLLLLLSRSMITVPNAKDCSRTMNTTVPNVRPCAMLMEDAPLTS